MLHWGVDGSPAPFVSRDAFQECVGWYREWGAQRIVFMFGDTVPAHAEYVERVVAGDWASRKCLDAFAAQAMKEMQDTPNLRPA